MAHLIDLVTSILKAMEVRVHSVHLLDKGKGKHENGLLTTQRQTRQFDDITGLC